MLYDVVVVTELSRIIRRLRTILEFIDELYKKEIDFVAALQNFDTTTAIGRAMLQLTAIFAELERAQTSERTTHTMNELAKQGKWLRGNIPKGYVKNGEEISIDSSEARIIRNIFEEFVAGETKSNLSKMYDINESITDYILRNAFYAGKISFGKRKKNVATGETKMSDNYIVSEGRHEAIIDEKLRNLAQEKLLRTKKLRIKRSMSI